MTDYGNNFKESEFACKCGCNTPVDMDQIFMDRLNALRQLYKRPIKISSGYRCPKHNDRVSTTGLVGPHTTRKAADILCSGTDAYEIVKYAIQVGFPRIGVKQSGDFMSRFIHLDTLTTNSPWIWTY